MGADGARADIELFGDLGIGQALRDQPQHFHLSIAQVHGQRRDGHGLGRGSLKCGRGNLCQHLLDRHLPARVPGSGQPRLAQAGPDRGKRHLVTGSSESHHWSTDRLTQDFRCAKETGGTLVFTLGACDDRDLDNRVRDAPGAAVLPPNGDTAPVQVGRGGGIPPVPGKLAEIRQGEGFHPAMTDGLAQLEGFIEPPLCPLDVPSPPSQGAEAHHDDGRPGLHVC